MSKKSKNKKIFFYVRYFDGPSGRPSIAGLRSKKIAQQARRLK
jgi:hypothetical protein